MGFFDGGAKSLGFGERGSAEAEAYKGKWRGGIIVNIGDAKQATNYTTKELEFWPKSTDPVMQLPLTLDTWAGKCPEPALDSEDDGVRDYYVVKGRQPYQAARAALRKAGAKDFEVGGAYYLRWVSGEGAPGDPRVFESFYEPPVQSSGGFMAEEPPAAPATPAMPPQPGGFGGAQAPAAAPRFDPNTGQPIAPPAAPAAAQPRFDPNTGQPIAPTPAVAPEPPRFDPTTGEPVNEAARAVMGQPADYQAALPGQGGGFPGQAAPAGPGAAPVNPFAGR